MTTTEKGRTRPRLIRLAAGVTLAGVSLGVLGVGVAEAAVAPPLNVRAAILGAASNPFLNIDWDAPTSGDPPTFYVVTVDNPATAAVDFQTRTPSTQTFYDGVGLLPGTNYQLTVESHDGVTSALSPIVFVTVPAAPVAPPVECGTVEWAPFCTVDAFIRQQYRDWLNRAPTLDELNFWRSYLQPRSTVAGGTQNVFLDNLRQEKDLIAGPTVRLYSSYFLRNPDFGGYTFWLDAVGTGGWSMQRVSDFFAASPEFIARYGALDNAEFVSLVYQNVLGRNPDAAGFAFWTRQLQSGQTRGWMMLQFTEAPSFEFQNKTLTVVAATEVWAQMLKRVPTLAEYDAAITLMAGPPVATYPLNPPEVNPLYLTVLGRAEYRARVTIR